MKKIILLFLISMLGLFFTACGGKLNTTVELESDMSGRRIMEYKVSQKDFQEYANVSIAVLEQQIAQKCPEGWTYEVEETTDSYVVTFIMPFSSIEDAITKMETVTGSIGSCEVSCYQAQGVFCEGFAYEEKFEAESILQWFKDMLVNCGCVDLTYISYVIDESETKLIYTGKQFVSGNTLTVKDFSYIKIDSIEIATYVNGDGTYNRTLAMSIRETDLNKRKEKILNFMEESIPTGASGEWTEVNGMHTHTVTLQNLSAEEMQEAMQTYTHSEETIFEIREHESEEEAYALLAREISYAEYMDFREYASSADGEVSINYIQQNENMKGELYFCLNEYKNWNISNIFGEEWRLWNFNQSDTEHVGDGIQTYPLHYLSKVSLVYRGIYYFDVTEISWDTEVKSKDQIETQISFLLSEDTVEEETDALILACEQKIAEENLKGVTVEKAKVKANEVILFTLSGTDNEINHARKVLTNTYDDEADVLEEKSAVACFEEAGMLSLKKTIVFEESVWPEGFLTAPENYQEELKVAYSLTIAGQEFSSKENIPSVIHYGGEYTDEMRVGMIHETVNMTAFLLIGATVFGVISVLVGIALVIIAMLKKGKIRKDKKTRVPVAVTPVRESVVKSNDNTSIYDAAEELAADLFGPDNGKTP